MSEERTQYTVHPDVAIRLQVSEAHIKHLTSTIDGMTMVMGRHRGTMREQAERIAELEQTVTEATERISYLNTTNSMRRTTIEEQTARIAELEATVLRQMETIARLEADNRRLRHLDAMPVDEMRRYYRGTVYTPAAAQRYDYMPDDYDTDSAEIYHWLFPHEGAA